MERSSLLVQEAACDFHEVEKRLRGLSPHAPSPVTEMFLQGCKDVVMGLTHWRYSPSWTPPYQPRPAGYFRLFVP
jgi:hypothetical protein